MMMQRFSSALALTAAMALAPPVVAQSDLAKKFGKRETVEQVSLSPDGKRLAMLVAMAGRSSALVVVDIANPDLWRSILRANGAPQRLDWCRWATVDRLVCGTSTVAGVDRIGFSQLLSLNADGGDMKPLTARTSEDALRLVQNGGDVIDWSAEDEGGGLLMTRDVAASVTTGSLLGESRDGLAVERIDPETLKRSFVESPRGDARAYITDGHGAVRVMATRNRRSDGYDATSMTYQYRRPASRDWSVLGTVTGDSQTRHGFEPYAVDRGLNVAYGFDDHDGRSALYKVALDGSLKRDLVYARPDVDIDGLVRLGRQNRVVGISYATDYRHTDFFDPELKRLGAALSKALPDLPLVSFVDASADEKALLLYIGSDVSPGHYAVFDKTDRHLKGVAEVRPELAGMKLAATRAITFPASDGTVIPAYLTLPPGGAAKGLPAIVMPHGGPSARDEWGFDWLVQFFAARGFAVLQPNFRGSSGYGAAWFKDNGFRSWRAAIGDVNDAGRWLVAQGIAQPARLAIMGWSYGGYAALQSPALDPTLYKAIVAVAPVTDLETLRSEHERYTDYKLVDAFIGHGDHVRAGSPAQNAAAIVAPVLLFHGTVDANVGIGESRLMASALRRAGKSVELVEFPGLAHSLDDSDARAQLLDRTDAFLRASLKM